LIDASDEEDEDGDESSDEITDEMKRKRPSRGEKAAGLASSAFWSYFVMTMIVTNISLMALEAQYPKLVDRPHFWSAVELFFLAFFTLEIGLRLYVSGRREFFCSENWTDRLWNWTDFGIVFMGLAAMVIRPSKYGWSAGLDAEDNNVSSSLLLLRGLRIIRVIRLFEQLHQLDLLIRGMVKSFEAVFWILVLGFLFILIFAIAVTTVVGHHSSLWSKRECRDCHEDDELRINAYFGDLGRSMWTMFQFVTLDEWASIIRLVTKRMFLMKYFFLAYTLLASFALISLLTGVMAEHIMSESLECQKEEERKEVRRYSDSLRRLFEQKGDASSTSRGLTAEQLHSLLSDREALEHLQKLGVNDCFTSEDLDDVFRAMDMDGDGMLTWDEFEKGLKNIHGSAGARELAMVRADVQRLLRTTICEEAACSQSLIGMEERMGRLEKMIQELMKGRGV